MFTLGQKIDIKKLSIAADGAFLYFFMFMFTQGSAFNQIFEPLIKT